MFKQMIAQFHVAIEIKLKIIQDLQGYSEEYNTNEIIGKMKNCKIKIEKMIQEFE